MYMYQTFWCIFTTLVLLPIYFVYNLVSIYQMFTRFIGQCPAWLAPLSITKINVLEILIHMCSSQFRTHMICDNQDPWNLCISVFDKFIWHTIGQKASYMYLALHSSLFWPDDTVNYDYIVTNSINSLLFGSRCISNGTHTLTIVEPCMQHDVYLSTV